MLVYMFACEPRSKGKKMKREEKSNLISALQSSLQDANGVFVVENHGLTVKEMEGLRKELRPIVSVFKVVKNRLMKLALQDTDFAPVSDLMKRPTAVAVATDGLAVTKVLVKFAEEHPNLTIVGGKMDADVLGVDDIVQLSKLPSLLEIRGTIARILVEPGSRLARVSAEYGKKNQ
jgi:large subunit ribosomal protein L10